MAGIYVHIPFCRQKCYYCDFYKTVNTSLSENFILALQQEIIQRKTIWRTKVLIPFILEGEHPSVLNKSEITGILDFLSTHFNVSPTAEITFEANPDDLSIEYLNEIFNAGVRRLSVGIQSFQNEFLKKMNRRHNSNQAIEAVENAAKK